jgi:hypothetical protein
MSVTNMLEELGDETDPTAIERFLDGMDKFFVAKRPFQSPFETALRERLVESAKGALEVQDTGPSTLDQSRCDGP